MNIKAYSFHIVSILLSLAFTGLLLWAGYRDGRNSCVEAAATYNPRSGDPCALNVRTVVPVNLTASTQVITGIPGKYTYICSLHIVAGANDNVALVEGTGTVCATNTAGMAGGTTPATGWNLGANLAVMIGDGGHWILATATSGNNVCLLIGTAAEVAGAIQFVQQ